jgi:pimeloyl-ACP methyl ester carboxylesterase
MTSLRATYTKAYWFGLYYNVQNSWFSYAANEGYATLAIDRLGNGQSSHSDALTAQIPLQVEILRLINEAARSGNLPLPEAYSGASFDKIIAVGHSLGSVVVNSLNWRYPSDANATLLTGYAPFYAMQLAGFVVASGLSPFQAFPSDTSNSHLIRTGSFYSTVKGFTIQDWQAMIGITAALRL